MAMQHRRGDLELCFVTMADGYGRTEHIPIPRERPSYTDTAEPLNIDCALRAISYLAGPWRSGSAMRRCLRPLKGRQTTFAG